MKIIAPQRVLARSSLLRRGKKNSFDIRVVVGTRATRVRRLFSREYFCIARSRAASCFLSREKQVEEARCWSDLSLKGRFFQAANPVDCVHKGPPSLEFPARRGVRVEDKDEGVDARKGVKGARRGARESRGLSERERCGWARGEVKKREGDKEIRKMGESSPDLSLRLRQGSSDSRDSFYMDFAQVCGGKMKGPCRLKIICLVPEPRLKIITRKDFEWRITELRSPWLAISLPTDYYEKDIFEEYNCIHRSYILIHYAKSALITL